MTTAYTALAGFKGVLVTDVWQFGLISLGVATVAACAVFGGHLANFDQLAASHVTPLGYGPEFLVGLFVFIVPSFVVRTDLWQRIAACSQQSDIRRVFLISAPIILVFYILLTGIGMLAQVSLEPGQDPAMASLLLAEHIAPQGVWGTLSMSTLVLGVFMALTSTIDTNLNVVSVSLSKLIWRRDWLALSTTGATGRLLS